MLLITQALLVKIVEKQTIAGRTLGEIARKLGKRVMPEVVPILRAGHNLMNPADMRLDVCLSEIIQCSSKKQLEDAFCGALPRSAARLVMQFTPSASAWATARSTRSSRSSSSRTRRWSTSSRSARWPVFRMCSCSSRARCSRTFRRAFSRRRRPCPTPKRSRTLCRLGCCAALPHGPQPTGALQRERLGRHEPPDRQMHRSSRHSPAMRTRFSSRRASRRLAFAVKVDATLVSVDVVHALVVSLTDTGNKDVNRTALRIVKRMAKIAPKRVRQHLAALVPPILHSSRAQLQRQARCRARALVRARGRDAPRDAHRLLRRRLAMQATRRTRPQCPLQAQGLRIADQCLWGEYNAWLIDPHLRSYDHHSAILTSLHPFSDLSSIFGGTGVLYNTWSFNFSSIYARGAQHNDMRAQSISISSGSRRVLTHI